MARGAGTWPPQARSPIPKGAFFGGATASRAGLHCGSPHTNSLCVPAPSGNANQTLRDQQMPIRAQERGHRLNVTSSHVACGDRDPEARGSPSTAVSKGQMRDETGSQDTWFLKGGEKIWRHSGEDTAPQVSSRRQKGKELWRTLNH